jgi:polysaccharide pyruvyl transferase WcaK-like protein
MGMRVMLYGNGIGPLSKPRNIQKARKALDACDYISLRDPESLEYIKTIGVKNPNVAFSVDPVFSLDFDDFEKGLPSGINTEANGFFAVSLRPWENNEPLFVEKIVNVINYTAEKYALTPILIPMQPIDMAILKEAAKRLACDSIFLPDVYPYKTIMAIIAHTQFAICMRLHTLIYAVSVGVPIIGLVYDPKVANFISYMNETAQMPTSNVEILELQKMIDTIMKDPSAAKARTLTQREGFKKLSDTDAKVAVGFL